MSTELYGTIDYAAVTRSARKAIRDAYISTIVTILEEIRDRGPENLEFNAPHVMFSTARGRLTGLPEHILENYPERIPLIFQHRFSDLVIDRDKREISVSVMFSQRYYPLNFTFDEITAFFDPQGIPLPDGSYEVFGMNCPEPEPQEGQAEEEKEASANNVVQVQFGKKE